MRFAIVHRTVYRYAAPVHATVQSLRLTPRAEAHQRPLRWKLNAPGDLTMTRDAYGNIVHLLSLHEPHVELTIEVHGEIEVDPLREGRLDDEQGLPPLAYCAETPLTAADARVRDFTAARLRAATPAALLDFALAIGEEVVYARGTTHVATTASRALEQGSGVCQDHAHVFVAGCRAAGIPARYVSGYYYTTQTPHAASHAWADAYLTGHGWISIDITHRCFASDALCRLAVGRDYDSACPVRGVRVGGADESMEVRVDMQPLAPAAAV
jgi:transglutaminase-like putative cysteine protease